MTVNTTTSVCLSAVMLWLGGALCASAEVTTVAVLDFAPTQDGLESRGYHWLSKAFSDLLIGDLGTDARLRVVTRENMRMLMQEADLRERSGLTADRIDPDEHSRMQQYLSVDHLVFGTYTITGDSIRLQAAVIDHASGEQLAQFASEGELGAALSLEKELAHAILRYYRAGELDGELWELPRWTDSMEAAERLYEGVDAYDGGLYTQAWYTFRRAATTDPGYADAVYWAARMYYYRQDYAHAQLAYRDFIDRFPDHPRIGDAVAEYVHSMESGALMTTPLRGNGAEHDSDADIELDGRFTPEQALALYRSLRLQDWGDAYVNNKVTYASRSPLSDWLMKREQQALVYLGRLPEAFALLEAGLESLQDEPADAMARSWRAESQRLMAAIAMESEDAGGPRLTSRLLTALDHDLTLENPVIEVDLPEGFTGTRMVWGPNYRMLAPPGYVFDTVRTEIFRTNDPDIDSVCRLQIRRYRYVDIDSCWTGDKGPNAGKRYTHTIRMPRGITWFYLRPEFDASQTTGKHARFDGWRLEAEFKPIAEDAGGILVDVQNAFQHETLIDGIYTRSYNGVIGNLAPGSYNVRIRSLWGGRTARAFEDYEQQIEVQPGQFHHFRPSLRLQPALREAGWNDPVGIATHYPTYKHRPRPDSNLLSGPPSLHIDPDTGEYLAVWSHLDTLWMSRSPDGVHWDPPDVLPASVNSADAEVNPRIIRDNRGRYCLVFLSNRGLFRNLAAYVAWSHDLRHWSRPIMLDDQHHDDLDFMQDSQGRYLLLLTPSPTSPDGGREQEASVRLLASTDLRDWAPAVEGDAWRDLFFRYVVDDAEQQASYLQHARPSSVRIVQDHDGIYHLVWFSRNAMQFHRAHSRDLDGWSQPEHVPYPLWAAAFNVSVAVAGDRIKVATIGTDETYSGREMFTILSGPLYSRDRPGGWRRLVVPAAMVNGIASMIHDDHRDELALMWQLADQRLQPARHSGPVYVIAGRPADSPDVHQTLDPMHAETGAVLDAAIDQLRSLQSPLPKASAEQTLAEWGRYHVSLTADNRLINGCCMRRHHGRLVYPGGAPYVVNWMRMTVIDPAFRNRICRGARSAAFFTLQQHVNATDSSAPELAALMVTAVFNAATLEALQAYRALTSKDGFWAAHARDHVQAIATNGEDAYSGYLLAVVAARHVLTLIDDVEKPKADAYTLDPDDDKWWLLKISPSSGNQIVLSVRAQDKSPDDTLPASWR